MLTVHHNKITKPEKPGSTIDSKSELTHLSLSEADFSALMKEQAARFADLKLDIQQATEQDQLLAKKPRSKPASKRKRPELLKEVPQEDGLEFVSLLKSCSKRPKLVQESTKP